MAVLSLLPEMLAAFGGARTLYSSRASPLPVLKNRRHRTICYVFRNIWRCILPQNIWICASAVDRMLPVSQSDKYTEYIIPLS